MFSGACSLSQEAVFRYRITSVAKNPEMQHLFSTGREPAFFSQQFPFGPWVVFGWTNVQAYLYSFAIVMYEMLAGRAPFVASSPHQYLVMHTKEPPPPLPCSH